MSIKTAIAWIGLGSNLGDRQAVLDKAVADLGQWPGLKLRAVSSYHETQPVGGPPGQGPFLNAAAELETTLSPPRLLTVLHQVEELAGRTRVVRWGERTLDLDLLLYDLQFSDSESLKLPHPRLAFRPFVLAPLVEIAPQAVDVMTNRTVADLLANLSRKPRLLAIDGHDSPTKKQVFQQLINELPGFGISSSIDNHQPTVRPLLEPFEVLIERFDYKIEALRISRWSVETLRVPWIVADYHLGLEMIREPKFCWEKFPTSEEKDRAKFHEEWLQGARAAAVDTLPATLVIVLSDDPERQRKPGLRNVPELWPDSSDPDMIIAEVMATCRSIEGI